MSSHGEAYLDIVWRQFKKNRPAFYSLWLLAPIFLVGRHEHDAPAFARSVTTRISEPLPALARASQPAAEQQGEHDETGEGVRSFAHD